ncbi:hypothetical protein GCM10022291_19420 [Postechiella marina]|uniref:Methyltransferase domain-containing protein n=1 Tax=Postechiella marina TaxID=943941 RepID=A0ABP8C9E0_9FLAO
MDTSKENTIKNEEFYDKQYEKVNIESILNKINNLNSFLIYATATHTSWVGLYHNNFKDQLKGKKVLELGCGDCTNAAIMSALGAEVHGNDISQKSGKIIKALNEKYNFKTPIKFINGDFLKAKIVENDYDIIVGKAFVHHLTHAQEIEFTEKIVKALKPNGMVRYFEPAVNNKILDEIRWRIPVHGRPSKFQKEKFAIWKENDPHPERDNSSKRYIKIGNTYFKDVIITPIGTIERFHRLLPKKYSIKFRRLAFKIEKYIPKRLNLILTRSQLIVYKNPRK